MYIQFLGTHAGLPGKFRNPSSLIVDLTEEIRGGQTILVDCAEGTQIQMIRQGDKLKQGAKPSVSKIDKIFITHTHLDHILGLPGLVATASSQGRTEPLNIYAPKGLKEWLMSTLKMTQTYITYPLNFTEVNVGDIYEFEGFKVTVYGLKHDAPSHAYHIQLDDKQGTLDAKKAMSLGASGPLLGKLKNGEDVILEDGTIIKSSDVVGETIKGKSVLICGDTKYQERFETEFPKNLDAIVYEGTLDEIENEEVLNKLMHSTFQQAARLGLSLNAKQTFINHVSGRYLNLKELDEKVKEINPTSNIVKDYDTFKI